MEQNSRNKDIEMTTRRKLFDTREQADAFRCECEGGGDDLTVATDEEFIGYWLVNNGNKSGDDEIIMEEQDPDTTYLIAVSRESEGPKFTDRFKVLDDAVMEFGEAELILAEVNGVRRRLNSVEKKHVDYMTGLFNLGNQPDEFSV